MHVDMACLKLILENVRLNLEKDDVIKWKGDNDGMFTVKNFFLHGWRSLKSFLIVNGISGYVWRKELPSQIKGFLWLAIQKAILLP